MRCALVTSSFFSVAIFHFNWSFLIVLFLNNLVQEAEITESSSTAMASDPEHSSTAKTDPSSSRVCSQPSDPTSSWKPCPLPGHQFSRHTSEGRVLTLDSLNEEGSPSVIFSFCSNDLSPGESHGRASSADGWSICSFSELVVSSQRNSRTSSQLSSSSFSSYLQTCGLCSKLLKERVTWKGNEIPIAAVLVCGHVYHAECLEAVTPEASKFDPSCPTCSCGESSAGNALLKAGSRTRNKISRRAVSDIDVDGKSMLELQKNESCMLKGLRLGASSSGRSSFGRSFLRRHLSFGSRYTKSAPERECPRKKGLWVRYQ